ncbi:hypothetical protein GGQ87_002221 [Brevundimonas alba]|uniref:Uncharacterized protein n=1 Tax=Brevundimonas alba TaxID=74314 RepID=A0A7X5YMJ4_9CAUL|nr:hypothetical protein [Brevundimonas alba]NJC41926.1 hypothetical protein [Brevundimonas alba]
MIASLFAALALATAPQQAPGLTTVVRTTLEQCLSGQQTGAGMLPDLADADYAQSFRNGQECGLMAGGWIGDDGALVAAAREAVGAEGSDWTGPVRELRVNESGPALWTRLEQAEGWAPASLLIIEPRAGERGDVEIHFDPAG